MLKCYEFCTEMCVNVARIDCATAVFLLCRVQETSQVNLSSLAKHVADWIIKRPHLEKHHDLVEDDGLIGLLTLATAVY